MNANEITRRANEIRHRMQFKECVRITLSELTDFGMEYESFLSMLQDKVQDALGQTLHHCQIVDYLIVDHEDAAIIMQVEGYDE